MSSTLCAGPQDLAAWFETQVNSGHEREQQPALRAMIQPLTGAASRRRHPALASRAGCRCCKAWDGNTCVGADTGGPHGSLQRAHPGLCVNATACTCAWLPTGRASTGRACSRKSKQAPASVSAAVQPLTGAVCARRRPVLARRAGWRCCRAWSEGGG